MDVKKQQIQINKWLIANKYKVPQIHKPQILKYKIPNLTLNIKK